MILKEEQKDLFTVPKNYTLVQCVSADFAMGAGIARVLFHSIILNVKELVNALQLRQQVGE